MSSWWSRLLDWLRRCCLLPHSCLLRPARVIILIPVMTLISMLLVGGELAYVPGLLLLMQLVFQEGDGAVFDWAAERWKELSCQRAHHGVIS